MIPVSKTHECCKRSAELVRWHEADPDGNGPKLEGFAIPCGFTPRVGYCEDHKIKHVNVIFCPFCGGRLGGFGQLSDTLYAGMGGREVRDDL